MCVVQVQKLGHLVQRQVKSRSDSAVHGIVPRFESGAVETVLAGSQVMIDAKAELITVAHITRHKRSATDIGNAVGGSDCVRSCSGAAHVADVGGGVRDWLKFAEELSRDCVREGAQYIISKLRRFHHNCLGSTA